MIHSMFRIVDDDNKHYLITIIKGDSEKTWQIKFCFPYILSPGDRIFKILVSIPHN